MKTPDKVRSHIYVIVTLIIGMSSTAMSVLDGIVIISCVLSNTSFEMTTYRLSRSTPVDSVACGAK